MKKERIIFYLKNPKSAIVKIGSRLVTNTVIKKTMLKILYRFPKRIKEDENRLVIGIYPTGGFGDYIISSTLIDEIRTENNCRIDVFCENIKFGKAVFGGRENLNVLAFEEMRMSSLRYDVILCVEHFTHVWSLNPYRVKKISPSFYKQMKKLEKRTEEIRPMIGQQCYREAMHFMRCEKLGIDRYTEQRSGDVFKIPNHKAFIPMDEKYLERVKDLGLDNVEYITVNRGADSMGRSGLQTKVWPKQHYDEFVKLFKKEYPNIKVIQLGTPNNDKIENVDQYVLGEDMEVTKWLLKESKLHIDCEGGLVHLATQLGTKCVVLFGPTPLHMYGYKENINLQAGNCHNCMGTHEDWAFECFRGMEKPECMWSLTPKFVFERVKECMN